MRRRADERGAVAVFTALLMTLLLVFSAFAVDLGMQRVARRDMQALADNVAIDLSRLLNGRTRTEIETGTTGFTALNAARTASLDRNDDAVVGAAADLVVTPYLVELVDDATDTDTVADNFPTTAGGLPVQVAAGGRPNAVVVVASTRVDFGFANVIGVSSGGATRSSVASSTASACFRIATMALGLATNVSALNGLLGDALDIGVLGYNGLANAGISLLGLETSLQALDPDGVLDLTNVSLGDLVLASASALSNTPGSDTADVTLLNTIAAQLDAAGEDGTIINVAELVGVSQGGAAAATTTLNVLDLLGGSAFIANGTNAINVPGLNLTLPGVASLTTRLYVTERPQRGCIPTGDGTAETAQTRLEITGTLSAGVPGVLTVGGPIRITLTLAQALGRLTAVTCNAAGVATNLQIGVESQALATTVVDLHDLGVRALLGLVTIPLVGLVVQTNQPAPTGTYNVGLPTYFEPTPFQTPQTRASLPSITAQQVSLLGIPLGGLVGPLLNNVLNPLLVAIDLLIANVLAPALGLRVVGVDLFGVRTPTCAGPKLIG